MGETAGPARDPRPVLLCFDGSENAAAAIAKAGELLGQHEAVVLTACEPLAEWEPYDPATILTAPVSRLGAHALGLDEIVRELARERADQGVALAQAAGFQATARVGEGKGWRVICDVAEELDAQAIVVGARGLSRVQSALLGSVSAAVVVHARQPVLVVSSHARPEPRGDAAR